MSIAAAAASGDRRMTLMAMRDSLAEAMDIAPAAVVAQIAGRLSAILAELDEVGVPGKVSILDELEARRTGRIAKATGDAPAKRPTRERRPRSG